MHLIAFDKKIGHKVPAVMSWLVEHVSDVLTKYLRGEMAEQATSACSAKQAREECLELCGRVLWSNRRVLT